MERFKVTWTGKVISSNGFSVKQYSPYNILYKDKSGKIIIDAESFADEVKTVQIDTKTIPDLPDRPRSEVIANIQRVADFEGWTPDFY